MTGLRCKSKDNTEKQKEKSSSEFIFIAIGFFPVAIPQKRSRSSYLTFKIYITFLIRESLNIYGWYFYFKYEFDRAIFI